MSAYPTLSKAESKQQLIREKTHLYVRGFQTTGVRCIFHGARLKSDLHFPTALQKVRLENSAFHHPSAPPSPRCSHWCFAHVAFSPVGPLLLSTEISLKSSRNQTEVKSLVMLGDGGGCDAQRRRSGSRYGETSGRVCDLQDKPQSKAEIREEWVCMTVLLNGVNKGCFFFCWSDQTVYCVLCWNPFVLGKTFAPWVISTEIVQQESFM